MARSGEDLKMAKPLSFKLCILDFGTSRLLASDAICKMALLRWRPKQKVLDHVSRHNGASMNFERFDYVDAQGRSKHMTGNKSYLSDYEEIDGGFVAFRGDPKGGRITGKGGLTCLFAKATLDESNLWHRRLGHINFKTMNKLVRGNLVRGLPSKTFENNHTCVACQKGKQHKASCKTKTVSSISQPLQMLHMDLFGPTFVKSLMKKMYCLVVTDDYSRFRWVFFLATKDETSEILKTFITGIENLIDLKVKVIRCDNKIEFKDKVMNQFCEMKGIKRKLLEPHVCEYIQNQRRNNHKDFQHCLFACFLSQIEPKKISEAFEDESWVDAMQEELLQFKIQKKDERGVVVRNKARLVAQGYKQEEGINYDKVFAPMARIEAIRIFLAFASYMVYSFIDPKYPKKVYKVVKALYGLHQAPRAWYATLSAFLEKSGYRRGTIDKTLFIKKNKKDIMLVQVYVDDIIFGSTKKSWCDEFEALMKSRFQMSSMGELTFFLGLQVKQKEDGIFISQDKYVAEILKKFDFISVKTASTPIETHKPLVKDEEAADVDVHLYRFQVTPKTSHLQAVKRIFRLISWQCKKQTIVATSTIEAEYVAAANCCGQVLWIHNQMLDYGFNLINTRIYIDNESTMCSVKNPVFHSKTKHIEIRHHFIRDAYEKKLIQVLKIHTDNNVADLLTKAFDVSRHQELASPKQTALGKDFSNPLIVDSLLKTIWFINAPCYCNEALAIPGQTATGKEFSNPLMADTTQIDIKEILGDTTQIDIEEILGDTTQIDIKGILGDTTQIDIEEILENTTQIDIKGILGVLSK
ncbi:putative ribonuclease H-like domain-containing protein [Tanacetum coccineum]